MTDPTDPIDPSDGDRVDDLLVRAARGYNVPRPIPREEIWAKIVESRQRPQSIPVIAPKGRGAWVGTGVGIAAALLLSTGIVIGRRIGQRAPQASDVDATMRQPSIAATSPNTGAPSISPAPGRSEESPTVRQLREETRRTDAAAVALAHGPASAGEGATSSNAANQSGSSLAYQLVVMRHLAGSEAMITSFRTSARRGERDSTMAEWSRALLATTRTLAASRVTNDPMMKRLLDDLDLVISQIVQYTTKGTHDPDELDLIEQSINRRGVITKLRSTLPTRTMSAGS